MITEEKNLHLKVITYYNVPEVAARITALMNGELDFVVSIPPDQIMALEGRKGIKNPGCYMGYVSCVCTECCP